MQFVTRVAMGALLLSFSTVSLSAEPADRPAGVAAESWVRVSDRLGVVLVKSEGSVPTVVSATALLLAPPANGYFMLKVADGWIRLQIVEPTKGPAAAG